MTCIVREVAISTSPRPDRVSQLRHVTLPVGEVGQQMEDRAIMPEIVCLGRKLRREDVCFEPGCLRCRRSEPGWSRRQRHSGEVQHRQPA